MQIDFKHKVLPHLLGIISFYLIVVVYFSPIVFDGKMMFQNDILQWEGSAKEVLEYREATGEDALWTNRMFGGMPAYLISTEFPGDITNAITKILTLGLPHPINSLFMGMIGMYILLLSFSIRPTISMGGAWAFAFNTFHIISLEAGHNAKIWAICLIPLILAGIHMAFSRRLILGTGIFALALMLQLKFNHLQITYYTLLIVLIYGLGQIISFVKTNQLPALGKIMAFLVVGAVFAVMANAGRLATTYEYGDYSIRGKATLETTDSPDSGLGKDYAFNWSQGILETMTFLVPNFYGGGSREDLGEGSASEEALRRQGAQTGQIRDFIRNAPTYWGEQPGTGGPIYGGAILIFMFVMGMVWGPRRFKYIFLVITILSFMLAWGKNMAWFNYAMFDYFPGYNKFRAVTMALSMALFAIPVMGAMGLESYMNNRTHPQVMPKLLFAFGVTGGIALILALIPGVFDFRSPSDQYLPDWLISAIREDRRALLSKDAWRSFIFIALAAGLVFAFLKYKIQAVYATAGIALLILADIWFINKRYLENDSFVNDPSAEYFQATPADNRIMADEGYYRVLNLENPFNEARTSYRFNSIGGYHGAKMRRYQDLIDEVLSYEMQGFIQQAQEGNFNFETLNALNMLNAKYFYFGASENQVFRNDNAKGAAWFPEAVYPVTSNVDEIGVLQNSELGNTATLNSQEFGTLNAGSGSIELVNYSPRELVYNVSANQSGLALFSEIYYPEGWRAFVDGQEVDILRANYLLRALDLPEGTYEVRFSFEPSSYYSAKPLMIIFQILILVLLGFGLFLTIKPMVSHGREG
ncbi:YfhO family protein [Litoribacter ruber]|uniref:YfhO family protein n=1 Tax=Litoribacter ruber TaxID=702568 RepID=A0AAP2G569_9BACT|nr:MULTISPECIES: YfhO family protein [Litoribacter]MBS9524796.1 YfhO family protein [Litoribacter alkaliphilus]MBT0812621.1 YfhO family protein [Litoribacter ruber]